MLKSQQRFRSEKHKLVTEKVIKVVLSANNDNFFSTLNINTFTMHVILKIKVI